ncbi:septum formation inhibitor Maf [Litorivicinus lipolyticus]|uniref:dTTP/UTP pyrophosphatase n=1 Tax=Litorivicinus lipolyticus TaxID=418701 RepID=A0A5Q2QF87_9GAMM|nr:Maf family protein [Litorivicinus lipolyticus]QGG80992.1 septum formation inhibitor Maf [Litorivicinus lipolyticus]
MGPDICLASQSPRRRELLAALGLSMDVVPADIDETPWDGELAQDHVARLARAKAMAVSHSRPVVAADTVVTIDGQILGKPADQADYVRMTAALSGRTHQVMTGWAIAHAGQLHSGVETTAVTFSVLTDAMVQAYWDTGEAVDKAGGYGIQGPAGVWVRSLAGDYNNVVGLPTAVIARALVAVGVNPWGLSNAR